MGNSHSMKISKLPLSPSELKHIVQMKEELLIHKDADGKYLEKKIKEEKQKIFSLESHVIQYLNTFHYLTLILQVFDPYNSRTTNDKDNSIDNDKNNDNKNDIAKAKAKICKDHLDLSQLTHRQLITHHMLVLQSHRKLCHIEPFIFWLEKTRSLLQLKLLENQSQLQFEAKCFFEEGLFNKALYMYEQAKATQCLDSAIYLFEQVLNPIKEEDRSVEQKAEMLRVQKIRDWVSVEACIFSNIIKKCEQQLQWVDEMEEQQKQKNAKIDYELLLAKLETLQQWSWVEGEEKRNYGKAYELTQKMVALSEKYLQLDHLSAIDIKHSLCRAVVTSDPSNALQINLAHYKLIKSIFMGQPHDIVIHSLNNLAQMYYHQNNVKKSIKYQTKVLTMFEHILNGKNLANFNYNQLILNLTQYLAYADNYAEVVRYLLLCLNNYEVHGKGVVLSNKTYRQIAEIHTQFSDIYGYKKQFLDKELQKVHLEKAFKIYLDVLDPEEFKEQINDLKEKLQQIE